MNPLQQACGLACFLLVAPVMAGESPANTPAAVSPLTQPTLSVPATGTENPPDAAPAGTQPPALQETPVGADAGGDQSTLFRRSLGWAVEVRDRWSDNVGIAGRYMDGLFSGKVDEPLPNHSYMQLSMKSTVSEVDGRQGTDYSLNGRLDLPDTRRNLKLFFESNNDDGNRLDEKVRSVSGAKSDSVGGLRLETDPDHAWRISTDAGVRTRLPLDPFVRLRVRRDWQLDDPWVLSFAHDDWDYREKGLGTSTSINFHRPITPTYFLSVVSAAQWQDQYDVWELSQSVTTTHILDEWQSMTYGAGVLGVAKPSVKATAWYVSANYHRRIYKNWFFLDVTPELLFPATLGYAPRWSLTFALKAIFADD